MVLKMPGQGIAVPWHRDRASTDDYPTEPPVFIADFYVDDADMDTCIWVVPGSHKWSDARTAEAISRSATGTASPPATPCRCRCLPARCCSTTCEHCEHCPSTRDYVIAKQKVLRACLRERRTTPYGADEAPFDYRPPPALDKGPLADGETPATFRYPANEYQIA